MDVRARFGANVRRLREARGLSQEAFGFASGIDRTYVSGVERGVRNPTITVVEKFARGLGVATHVLLMDVDAPADESSASRNVSRRKA
jgi:transcriptional regulator with XRE-family HTH domain